MLFEQQNTELIIFVNSVWCSTTFPGSPISPPQGERDCLMIEAKALLARALTFRRSLVWREILITHPRQHCRLRSKLSYCLKVVPKMCVPHTVTQRNRLPHQKFGLFHFLSSMRHTSFPFLQFSTAASLVSNFYPCVPKTFSEIGCADAITIHSLLQCFDVRCDL